MASSSPTTTEERQDEGKEGQGRKAKPLAPSHPKRRGGVLSLVRAAFFMTNRSSKPKKPSSLPAEVVRSGSNGLWRNLMCGMRPLHAHQVEHLPPMPTILPPPSPDRPFHDVLLPPPSPASSIDGMSRYTSAEDLQTLEVITEEDAEIAHDGGSSSLIDVQAEEFIAKFYEQMRLQRLESIARTHSMIIRAY